MKRLGNIEEIERLFAEHGGLHYGEDVTLIEHSVQCASLAEADRAPPSLIIASLLHDIGHLFESEADATTRDHRHQLTGADALADLFDEAVCQAVALHVDAKRYLCHREPRYFEMLSAASKETLRLQGGIFTAAEAAAFEKLPGWGDAVALRRYDDEGKSDELSARSFAEFVPVMRALMISRTK